MTWSYKAGYIVFIFKEMANKHNPSSIFSNYKH